MRVKTVLALHKEVDSYTVKHQRNVSIISGRIAKELGFDKKAIMKVKLCALVHDIGKISIPISILDKASSLSYEEFELIKSHVKIPGLIHAKSFHEAPFFDVITQHHERLDGSGYPYGLKGDRICIEAKIVAVADVYDAIATDRPYRKSLGYLEAIEHILSGQGRLYDKDVVMAFKNAIASK